MQAIRVHQFGGLDALIAEDVPKPVPGEGEVLLRVKAAGVGPWDAVVRSGGSVLPQPLPLTLGTDVAGIVERIGLPLSAARMAHEMLAGKPHKPGKIVLRVDRSDDVHTRSAEQ